MKKPLLVYSLLRAYIADARSWAPERLCEEALGLSRSRNIPGLASFGDLSGGVASSAEARFRLQIAAFVKKNATLEHDDADEVALQSFHRAERICRITNRRLDYFNLKPERLSPDLQLQVEKMRKTIARVLGTESSFISEIPELIRITSGATATLPRRRAHPVRKIRASIDCVCRAVPYLKALSAYFGESKPPNWVPRLTNRVEFVPKNWKTRRTIGCEPTGSLPLQLAVDAYVKRRLRKFGIDLSDQSVNQCLARAGSIDGSIATVDLEMASDTVALNLVYYLFPEGWATHLCDFRSPGGVLPNGEVMPYAKFASMGNGSTFVVETLVFFAAARAVGSTVANVYGDDIAIETELVAPLTRLLRFLGFKTNSSKTFSSGSFRESCGSNWFGGIDVTPMYMRREPASSSDAALLVNGLARIGTPDGECWKSAYQLVTEWRIPIIPLSEDPCAGVWVTPRRAHMERLVRYNTKQRWVARVKALVPIPRGQVVRFKKFDRAAFLWHLAANHRGSMFTPHEVANRYPASDYVYVRRWVCWVPPAVVAPPHLYWWEDYLFACKGR
jgi:hypothetical protein